MKILMIHGPNMNLLGVREVGIYGNDTIDTINARCQKLAKDLGLELDIHQSNSEGEIIDLIHSTLRNGMRGIIINPGAFTHYSYAIRDAIAAVKMPCVEVHLSNVYSREDFRHKSVIAPVATGQISGFQGDSYTLAIQALVGLIRNA